MIFFLEIVFQIWLGFHAMYDVEDHIVIVIQSCLFQAAEGYPIAKRCLYIDVALLPA